MPQYKIKFRSDSGVHEYVRYGANESEAKDFVPLTAFDDDFENLVPLVANFESVEEMEIWADFSLDSETYFIVQKLASDYGLKAAKAVGSYCLEVRGYGDWLKQEWIQGYKRFIRNSNYIV